MAAEMESTPCAFDALPDLALTLILKLLPVDERLRSREVCTAWRRLLSAPQLWEVCNLSKGGIAAKQTEELLESASAAAAGTMRVLDVSGWTDMDLDALVGVAAANASTLVELSVLDITLRVVDDEAGDHFRADIKCLVAHHLRVLRVSAPELLTLRCRQLTHLRRRGHPIS